MFFYEIVRMCPKLHKEYFAFIILRVRGRFIMVEILSGKR